LPNGKACFDGRPGAELPAFAFEDEKQGLLDLFGKDIRDVDVMTHAQYPQVREGREGWRDGWMEGGREGGTEISICNARSHTHPPLPPSLPPLPQVFAKHQQFYQEYNDVSVLDTRTFLQGLKIGQEVSVELEHGKTLFVKLNGVGEVDATGHRDVIFELNGQQRVIKTKDLKANVKVMVRPKAEMGKPGSVGAPMPGLVVSKGREGGREGGREEW